MVFLKIWTWDRQIKRLLDFNANDSSISLDDVITKASSKLEIKGELIVLESDGSLIDAIDMLKHFQNEPFIILQRNREWQEQAILSPLVVPWVTQNPENSEIIDGAVSNSLDSSKSSEVATDVVENQENQSMESLESETNSEQSDPNEKVPPKNDAVQETLKKRRIKHWDEFEIAWECFSPKMLAELEAGARTPELIKYCVHTVVNDMKYFSHTLPIAVRRRVAKKMLDR
ncbi:hypothetical protein QAD02_013308 [Eretmocerus hayati]|uniref:Uncharacterized protein n=1 Tax=Eretmocerus hayati TaxID=131215 RepID=A0ACC2P382_9HYME|nr:hypothetical protein QAD02_013308 [Eretmocerus hayati]